MDIKQIAEWLKTELRSGMVLAPKNAADVAWNDAHQRAIRLVKKYAEGKGLFQVTAKQG